MVGAMGLCIITDVACITDVDYDTYSAKFHAVQTAVAFSSVLCKSNSCDATFAFCKSILMENPVKDQPQHQVVKAF